MMKHLTKYIKINFIIFSLFSFIISNEISMDELDEVINNFIIERAKSDYTKKSINLDISNDLNNFYIVELDPKGFIIVSANTNFIPILGYSFDTSFNIDDLPSQLEEIINSYRDNILSGISNNIIPNEKVSNRWIKYTNELERDSHLREVPPLITANWNQGGGWNDMCPGNSLVGCVAVAMGQVIYYWQHPLQGSGYSSYYHQEYGPISVNFDDYIYDFERLGF